MPNFVKTSGKSILVPPGIPLSPVITGSFPVGQGDVGALPDRDFIDVNFRLEYSEESRTYEIAAFGLDRKESAAEISGALWRTVRVHSIVRTAIEASLPDWIGLLPRVRFRRRDGILIDPPTYDPSDPDGLLLTALAYRVAEVTDENPALAVAETMGLKQRTATNWIARARAAGYMTSTEHEQDARRIARDLGLRIPLGDRPRTEEEMTLGLARGQQLIQDLHEHLQQGEDRRKARADGDN